MLDFDRALAEMSAEDFVQEVLVERLAIGAAVTGYDFHFGKARRGTPQFLAEQGMLNGFSVTIVEALDRGRGGGVLHPHPRRARGRRCRGRRGAARLALRASPGRSRMATSAGATSATRPPTWLLDPATELAHGIYAVRFVRAGRERA